MKETIVFILAILLWIAVQIWIDERNSCSNFAPNNIAGNCTQEIEE